MKRITVSILVLLFNFTECLSATLYREIGLGICLNFTKENENPTLAIKREDKSICLSPNAVDLYTFPVAWNNKTFNCTLSGTQLSVCFDFQLEDIGLFSSHPSASSGSKYLQNITLERAVSVASVNLTPTSIFIIAGEKMNLTCTTSYCNPPANITWYLSSTDITSHSSYTRNKMDDLLSTKSLLQMRFDKIYNKKQVYCSARNIPGRTVNSTFYIVNVLYVPEVTSKTQNPYPIVEGGTATLVCEVTDANPNTNITWKWFKSSRNTSFLHNDPKYTLSNIKRDKTGLYSCIAINSVGTSVPISRYVDVQYKPEISAETKSPYRVIEGQKATLECKVMDANPNTSITWKWYKLSSTINILNSGPIYEISIIERTSSGSFNCSAFNSIGGSVGATITIDVQYKPEVTSITPSPLKVTEGSEANMECELQAANPNASITWSWFRTDKPSYVLYSRPTYKISNIQRNRTGSYSCTANNSVGTSVAVTVDVDVQYKPEIVKNNHGTEVNENEQVTLYRQIISNPLSNVSWYKGSDLLKNQWSVRNATFNIEKATCTDTKNYTLLANNGVQENVTALVELIVNCKPRSDKTNFTLGVTDTTGIDFSTFVIAYPEPLIKLEYENGTESNQMMKSINRNAVNNFTIQISQAVVNQSDFGVYHLKVNNSFGELIVIMNVIPQRKPNVPVDIEIVCEVTRAEVQWKSSFNGGDPQLFTVIASSGQQSNNISDRGENVIHSTFVQHLKPSTMYVFYVSAQNSHGFISSEKISCTTLAESSEKLPIIVGSAAAGGLTLVVVVVVVVVFLFRRYTNTENQAGKSQRFENDLVENESVDDDGLRDNILYVSADPRENEKHKAAVYAAVNKKDPMSNNNSNVYAEVKKNGIKGVEEGAIYSDVKPKKGFFKKDGKVKNEKRQKRKQEVADVYENSDDIAMTANPDNVYSNTNHNNDSAKEHQGYKNKDGLLYVEVQFDTKAEQRNPVIHGDDEKTDYATVEFPMASSSHDRE